MIKVIKSEEEYEHALEMVEELMDLSPEPGTDEGDILELLILLISVYEKEHYPISMPDPIEAIKFRMQQQELSQNDLIPFLGSRSKVSEVLNGKRPLSLTMIRALHNGLGIPAEILLQKSAAFTGYPLSQETHIADKVASPTHPYGTRED
jgi:HTH-type transcriptional regulator / antitoxin HigA